MKLKIIRVLVPLLVALSSNACASNMKTITIAERVSFQVPPSIEVVQESPVEDFVLAQFKSEGRLLLGAYVGNAPEFPGSDCTNEVSDRMIGRFAAKEAKGKKGSSCFKEVLIDLGEGRGWPRFVHVRFERASQQQVQEAEAIVSSIRWIE